MRWNWNKVKKLRSDLTELVRSDPSELPAHPEAPVMAG
jgi:hypothetical protein